MRKILAGLAALLIGFTIACDANSDERPTGKKSPSAASPTATSDPNTYLNQVVPGWPAVTADDMLTLGESVCTAFDRGVTPQQLFDATAKEMPDQSALQIRIFIQAAGRDLCPRHAAIVEEFEPSPAPVPAAPPPPPPAPPKPASPVIDDGTWTVGQDNIPPGTYRTAGIAGADCYWSIFKSGTNQADIVTNHIGGGRLTVTLRVGQDFTTERCGTWVKIK